MRAHIIENNKVVNTIEVDSLDFLPNLIDASLGGSIGDSYIGSKFIKPVAEVILDVPVQVAMWQARDILIKYDLLDDVINFANEIEDPMERRRAKSRFEFSSTVLRSDPLLNFITSRAGYAKETVDSWFIEADALL